MRKRMILTLMLAAALAVMAGCSLLVNDEEEEWMSAQPGRYTAAP